MAKRIFVTATNTDIGKTYTSELLLNCFANRGIRVGVVKPIETGVVNGYAPDGERLLACMKKIYPEFWHMQVSDIVPITYEKASAPFIASNASKIDFTKIDNAIEAMEMFCDILIIEGAGGLYVPIEDEFMMIDLIKYLKASALLVTHCSLGCINDTLLSKKALENEKISYVVAFNCKEGKGEFQMQSESYFIKTNQKVLKVDDDIDTICDVLYNL